MSRKQTLLRAGWPSVFTVKRELESALARLVTRLDFVDDVDLALATHDLAGRVAQFGGFDGGNDFHKGTEEGARVKQCQRKISLQANTACRHRSSRHWG